MKIQPTHILITFLVIVIIIILSDNVTNSVLIISLLANFLVIITCLTKITKPTPSAQTTETFAKVPPDVDKMDSPSNMYGPFYEMWKSYNNNEVKPAIKPHEYGYGQTVDDLLAVYGRARTRDKEAMIGSVVKDSEYYKYHYGDDFDMSENKVWWGKYDI